MRTLILTLTLVSLVAGLFYVFNNSKEDRYQLSLPVGEAVKIAKKPLLGYSRATQSFRRVLKISAPFDAPIYIYNESHSKAWDSVLSNIKHKRYFRLIAGMYLLNEGHMRARSYFEAAVTSNDIRLRFNALALLAFHLESNPKDDWAVKICVNALSTNAASPAKEFSEDDKSPEGDGSDWKYSPIHQLIYSLENVESKEAEEVLIKILLDPKRRKLHSTVIDCLGKAGSRNTADLLIPFLDDESRSVRISAIRALGDLQNSKAIPALAKRFGEAKRMQSSIIDAIRKIGGSEAVEFLKSTLQNGKIGDFNKFDCEVALVELESENPLEKLNSMMVHESDRYRKNQIIGIFLSRNSNDVLPYLLPLLNEVQHGDVHASIVFHLADMRTKESLMGLAKVLSSDFPNYVRSDVKGAKSYDSIQIRRLAYLKLCRATRKDFGSNSAKWTNWISKNYE